jgi:hypothetical protein
MVPMRGMLMLFLVLPSAGAHALQQAPLSVPAPRQSTAVITIDTATRFQRMSGWEANAQSGEAEPGFVGWQAELMDLAANDLGINRIRVELRSGAEHGVDYYARFRAGTMTEAAWEAVRYAWANDNGDPTTINPDGFSGRRSMSISRRRRPCVAPRARGETLLNLNYVSFGTSTAHHDPAEYAELMLAAFSTCSAGTALSPMRSRSSLSRRTPPGARHGSGRRSRPPGHGWLPPASTPTSSHHRS